MRQRLVYNAAPGEEQEGGFLSLLAGKVVAIWTSVNASHLTCARVQLAAWVGESDAPLFVCTVPVSRSFHRIASHTWAQCLRAHIWYVLGGRVLLFQRPCVRSLFLQDAVQKSLFHRSTASRYCWPTPNELTHVVLREAART